MAHSISLLNSGVHLVNSLTIRVEQTMWDRLERGEEINDASISEFIGLLDALSDPFITQSNRPSSIFFLAVLRGQAAFSKKLIEYVKKKNISLEKTIEEKNGPYEFTALQIATIEGYIEIIKMLLDAGASFQTISQDGFYPLYLAIERNDPKAVKCFLEHAQTRGILAEIVEAQNGTRGFTALHQACSEKNGKIVALLLDAGASLFSATKDNLFPLYIAVANNNQTALEIIIEHLKNYDPETRLKVLEQKNGPKGITALGMACINECPEIVSSLLQAGSSFFSVCNQGFSALYVAVYYEKKNVIIQLLIHAKKQGLLKELLEMKNGPNFLTVREVAKKKENEDIYWILFQAEYHVRSPEMFSLPGTTISLTALEEMEKFCFNQTGWKFNNNSH